MSTVRWQVRALGLGLGLAVLAVLVFFAPTYIGLKGGNGAWGTCLLSDLPAGYPVKDLDPPSTARLDLVGGSLTCEWGPYAGEIYVSVFHFGSPTVHVAAAAAFGFGVCLAVVGAYGMVRKRMGLLSRTVG